MPLASRRTLVAALCVLGALGVAGPALAGPEEDLAARYAPVVRLVDQPDECGPGEPYIPTDVDVLFNEPTVALRGPWNRTDLVKIAPAATDLVTATSTTSTSPATRSTRVATTSAGATPHGGDAATVYAHVATDPGYPGKLALQYWFFYLFNDFNNTHEGDWEMIQLVFDAADAARGADQDSDRGRLQLRTKEPSAPTGATRSSSVVDGTHPVVYPAAGSHANKFTAALYLGSSADAGVGCDDTRGPHRELRPVVKTIPSDPAAAKSGLPVDRLRGPLGRAAAGVLQRADRAEPEEAVDAPDRVVAGLARRGAMRCRPPASSGRGATDLFCGGVAKGSQALVRLLRNPPLTLLVLAALLALLVFAAVRATWLPVAPLRSPAAARGARSSPPSAPCTCIVRGSSSGSGWSCSRSRS